jgi:hypothetical protein
LETLSYETMKVRILSDEKIALIGNDRGRNRMTIAR